MQSYLDEVFLGLVLEVVKEVEGLRLSRAVERREGKDVSSTNWYAPSTSTFRSPPSS